MKIVCTADTHAFTPELPEGDVLIFAGDYSERGNLLEFEIFLRWISQVGNRYKKVIFVPGNHDIYCEKNLSVVKTEMQGMTVLNGDSITFEGVLFWGSPITPEFNNWAFMKKPEEMKQVWSRMHPETDVLITHGPPQGILDRVSDTNFDIGCPELLKKVLEVKPKYHIFGHIHEGYGMVEKNGTTFINVSYRDYENFKRNQPVVIEI